MSIFLVPLLYIHWRTRLKSWPFQVVWTAFGTLKRLLLRRPRVSPKTCIDISKTFGKTLLWLFKNNAEVIKISHKKFKNKLCMPRNSREFALFRVFETPQKSLIFYTFLSTPKMRLFWLVFKQFGSSLKGLGFFWVLWKYLRSSQHRWQRHQLCHSIIKWIINIFAEIDAVKSALCQLAGAREDDTNLDTLWGIMVYFF